MELTDEEREALYLVLDAAESWLNEMHEYIIPGEPDLEISDSYQDRARDIAEALRLVNGMVATTESGRVGYAAE